MNKEGECVMFENFKKMAKYQDCTDEQMRTFFYELSSEDHIRALDLLEEYRPDLAKAIAREILAAATQ